MTTPNLDLFLCTVYQRSRDRSLSVVLVFVLMLCCATLPFVAVINNN